MITLKLNKADINFIVDMMCDLNERDRYFMEDQYINLEQEQFVEMNEMMDTRSNIINTLTNAIRKGQQSKR